MHTRLRAVVRLAVLAALGATLLFAAVPSSAQPQAQARPAKIMTRNLYLGADISRIFTATSLQDLIAKSTQTYSIVQATDFPARAKVLAREIQAADPTLIGLQEVSLWRTGAPDGPATLATTVAYDFLQSLLSELVALGRPYTVVVAQSNADGEAPTSLGFDARLTQRNVILAKAGLPPDELVLANAQAGHYQTVLTFPTIGGPVVDTRGWTAVDATVNRRRFRLINTHLDSTVGAIRVAQASELLSGPASTPLPVVLVGDLNSSPEETKDSAYAHLTGAGFVDTWTQANPGNLGLTWGHAENLLNPTPTFSTRIDYVLTRPRIAVIDSRLVGIDRDNRTPSGLWPSDHAGIIATLAP